MVTLTNLPTRCVSVASSQGNSSNNSVASSTEGSENPFMTLVDAATSLFDRKATDQTATVLKDVRMSTPQESRATSPAATPVSPDAAKIPVAVEVKTTPASPCVGNNKKDENKKQTFSELLMAVLDDPAHQEVICWMPDGKALTIRNHKKFTMDLMPKLFNIRNMSSFVRKLGRWGFSRVHEKETRNSDIFKHKSFHRGEYELCKSVKCIGRLQNKPTPSSSSKTVIDLVNGYPVTPMSGSPTFLRTNGTIHRIPSPPVLVTPTGDKALLRLEHARRLSANSRPPVFRGKGFGTMTNDVMEAAIETLRRDEETVIVAMPKKYLQSRRGPPPGVRVLSTGAGFAPPSSYPAKAFSRSSFVRHAHHHTVHPLTTRAAPVALNTRPTNSGAVMAHYGARKTVNRSSFHSTGSYRR